MPDIRYGSHQARTTQHDTSIRLHKATGSRIDQRATLTAIRGSRGDTAIRRVRWGSGEALMAKKVVGDVMIIQKNADARTHPRPPAWTRKDLDAQWRAIDS